MKQLVVLAGCAVILLGLVGCQNTGRGDRGVEVIIEGGCEFPQFLVGTWKADRDGWEFVFEPDGRISSAVISLGRVRMEPGKVTTVPMKMGGKKVFEPGKWMVYYAPSGRELTVEISLKNFYAKLGEDVLEGKSTDIFVGTISEDGKVWQVDWVSFPDYVAHTEEYPNFDLSTDPDYGTITALTFEKFEESK